MTDTITITFKAVGVGPETSVRVRRLLKASLRSYGLRCLDISVPHQTHVQAMQGAGLTTNTNVAPTKPLLIDGVSISTGSEEVIQ